MTPGADARERPDAGPASGPRVPRAHRPAAAPARPALEGEGFGAALELGPPPRALTASVVLWLLTAAVGLVAAGLLWLDEARVRGGFAAAALEQDASTSTDVVDEAARYAFWASAGSVALVAVLLALLALVVRRGRPWARTLLLPLGAVAAAVAVVVQDLVRSPAVDLLADPARLALLAQVPLAVAAVVLLVRPAVRGWLRRAQARAR
jgi:hypothetical protein